MSSHEIASIKTRKVRGQVYIVTTVVCECGADFPSISSEAMARSYHKAHKKLSR